MTLGMRDEIVILIVPAQGIGAGSIESVAVMAFAVNAPVEIPERDLHVACDRVMDAVYVVVNALVHRFDAAGDRDLPPEAARIVTACQLFQLRDQLHRLPLREEARGLHRIDKKLQLRQLELARSQKISAAASVRRTHIHTELLKAGHVAVNALALGPDPHLCKLLHKLLRCDGMVFIRLLL